MLSVGLLIIRLIIGLLFVGHGAQKLFGWFGGHGLKGTGGWFESIGMKPGVTVALLAGLSELFGGIMFALGFLTPLAGIIIAGTMVMAIVKVHGANGLWVTNNGYEYNLTLLAVTVGIALTGPGQYAVDTFLF
ncbi:DoxX family protein [Bacillus atrophaeus]|uniref:DoxX family protein n=1 Tax=Bacillus atrophaeus TaxID=1452 RepID=UPI002281754A|nr:DoxX family protein [Bacillus atrophaeus]MCY8826642.1 DoxX family protein [Bacillus atrophaeus]MCY8843182.1 DoxX family protein [Bacillus atrophaeus]MEC0803823.1 DoxX family protein [Bacillus atrophaeus]MEC0855541.1 DoxX family protein [Bacillus atrophaeus]MEC0858707.1 DoxX family protein [Bacillus atrophaeus]